MFVNYNQTVCFQNTFRLSLIACEEIWRNIWQAPMLQKQPVLRWMSCNCANLSICKHEQWSVTCWKHVNINILGLQIFKKSSINHLHRLIFFCTITFLIKFFLVLLVSFQYISISSYIKLAENKNIEPISTIYLQRIALQKMLNLCFKT